MQIQFFYLFSFSRMFQRSFEKNQKNFSLRIVSVQCAIRKLVIHNITKYLFHFLNWQQRFQNSVYKYSESSWNRGEEFASLFSK